MNLAICTIQRDRGPWLKEWVAFHHVVGFRKFYIYLHKCTDDSMQITSDLSRHFDITAFTLPDDTFRPQLAAYQHCYAHHGALHDWMAFIDGDEFLFSPEEKEITNALQEFEDQPIGAIGAYWSCFGSSGHIAEPEGLVTENYRWRAPLDFKANSHFKSIVRGRQGEDFSILQNSHCFGTRGGTIDSRMRPLTHGRMDHAPCFEKFRINHYVTQSREYFVKFKQQSGAADAGAQAIRSEQWWLDHNHNEVWDESLLHLNADLHSCLQRCNHSSKA